MNVVANAEIFQIRSTYIAVHLPFIGLMICQIAAGGGYQRVCHVQSATAYLNAEEPWLGSPNRSHLINAHRTQYYKMRNLETLDDFDDGKIDHPQRFPRYGDALRLALPWQTYQQMLAPFQRTTAGPHPIDLSLALAKTNAYFASDVCQEAVG